MMWPTGEDWAALIGGDSLRVVGASAWYDGRATVEDLDIAELTWSSQFDGSAVRDTLRCTVTDRAGDLVTEKATSPLACYGQQIIARAIATLPSGVIEESIPLGSFVINSTSPSYRWAWHDQAKRLYSTGGTVEVDCTDCLTDLVDAQFTGPTAPRAGIAAEIARLCAGYVGVDLAGVPTGRVPASITYGESKWDAVKALAAVADLVPAPGRDGTLRFRRAAVGSPVWAATSGERSLIDASLAHSREGLVNQVLATGEQDSDGVSPVRALAQETSGPFRAGGPLKEKLQRHSSSFYRTYSQAKSGADQILARAIRDRTLKVPFKCAWNPALDVLDTISIEHEPLRPPISALVVSLECSAGQSTMSGEAIVSRSAL